MSYTQIRDRRILVVDDEERMVRFIRLNLEHDGFQVIEAYRGLQAIQSLRDRMPDLILLDLNLPRMDGREVLAEIKNDDDLKHIPVVILTTSRADEDVLRSYDLHANCYITKPVDLAQFEKIVRSIEEFWFTIVALPKG